MGTSLRALPGLMLTVVLLHGCASDSSPVQYTRQLTPFPNGEYELQLESVGDMSAAEMRAALLTEAARGAIEAGQLFLRIDEISTDWRVDMKQRVDVNPVGGTPSPSPVATNKSGQTSQVSFSRHRRGVVRFTAARGRPPSGEVYDASELLDQIRAGSVPPAH
jgi:hypothetical protein